MKGLRGLRGSNFSIISNFSNVSNFSNQNEERKTTMKLKVNWKALGKALWEAVKPVLLAAIGGGLVAVSSGCSSMTPSSKTRFARAEGVGLPERESANPEGAARGRVDGRVRPRHPGHRDHHAVHAERGRLGRRHERADAGQSGDGRHEDQVRRLAGTPILPTFGGGAPYVGRAASLRSGSDLPTF